ncbi:putative periplasmic solute-binding protein of a sugar uptake ABC transporter system [Oceanicola granulosus HTCC2516]|uniref:Putative periplasmic solute-binding protein of a sugar uptake ABC transporter system n=1 Tax=Oceanicola granulosus (strain ATCC BAA-861 / DSM 15982 / KCTC 12143 / HTCC2516) TaxID=314256 RepID=Q2CFD0_OCEGH|nr:sugar ABC transporter substrate-binding protein [Oceanicola granulosus]EAR51365.1 putative periplasmic solute-binding protein of a sugar uptake ABC transporter system [Oceanicola granulosus HTCC2516]
MNGLKTLGITAILLGGSGLSASAQELHFIMCGGEVREADQKVIDEFTASREGVTVNMEAVPWGTCQDKSLTLAAAGDPPSIAYMGSRTLRQLANNDLIVPAQIPADLETAYQPGVLDTVTIEGTRWGYPHAFSTKALYINCDLVEEAGAECVAPQTWDEMISLAETVRDNTEAAGVGLAGKDFDNTMHQFLNYLYSNGGTVIDTQSGENMLDSQQTRETLEFYGRLVDVAQEGPTAWERDQLRDLFNDGQIAMYVQGPWGRGQHNEDIDQLVVPIPAGPSGEAGTILITDSLVVFKGTGHEDLAHELAQALATGEAQYDLDQSWGLTPIFKYEELGMEDTFYKDDPFWQVFVDGIATGGPEPLVEDFKSLQSVFTNMVQGVILEDDSVENLVTIAGEELDEAL